MVLQTTGPASSLVAILVVQAIVLQCFASWLEDVAKYVNSLLYPWVQYNGSLHSHNFKT